MMVKKRKKKKKSTIPPVPETLKSTHSAGKSHGSKYGFIILPIMILCTFLVYSNSFQVPFVFDDFGNILKNTHIRLTNLNIEDLLEAGFESRSSKRPVANISFALNYYFHQYDVFGYHLVNFVIHVLTGLLLFSFVRATLRTPALIAQYSHYRWIPHLTAFLWLVHPIQTQAVTYIVQRMTSLSAMFTLLAVLLYIQGRFAWIKHKSSPAPAGKTGPYLWFTGGVLAWLLALGSKQIAAVLPFFVILYEWYFFQDLAKGWLRKRWKYFAIVIAVFTVISLIYLGTNPIEKIFSFGGDFGKKEFTYTERLLTLPRVIVFYLSLLFFPHPSRLNLNHYFSLSSSLFDPFTTVASLAFICLLIGLALHIARKDRLISFCILWFFGTLAIESTLIPLALVYEHRLYMPSMLVCLLAVIMTYRYVRPNWLLVGIFCGVLIICSVWTYERNMIWRDRLTLWEDCVKKAPQKWRSQYNYANWLMDDGQLDKAKEHFNKALQIRPFHDAFYNLGLVLIRQKNFEEAEKTYKASLQLNPEDSHALNKLGVSLSLQGKYEEAIIPFHKAIEISPDYAAVYSNLADTLVKQGKTNDAAKQYYKALSFNPRDPNLQNALADVLLDSGKLQEAVNHYSEALRIKPDYQKAHINLGVALAQLKNYGDAARHFSDALLIGPEYAEVHYYLGMSLANLQRHQEAKSHFSDALRLDPNHSGARWELNRYSKPQRKTLNEKEWKPPGKKP